MPRTPEVSQPDVGACEVEPQHSMATELANHILATVLKRYKSVADIQAERLYETLKRGDARVVVNIVEGQWLTLQTLRVADWSSLIANPEFATSVWRALLNNLEAYLGTEPAARQKVKNQLVETYLPRRYKKRRKLK